MNLFDKKYNKYLFHFRQQFFSAITLDKSKQLKLSLRYSFVYTGVSKPPGTHHQSPLKS